jgi:hypothetical protein
MAATASSRTRVSEGFSVGPDQRAQRLRSNAGAAWSPRSPKVLARDLLDVK